MSDNIFQPQLLEVARSCVQKAAFIGSAPPAPGGDPAGGGMPMPGGSAMAGALPPVDPMAAMGGGDPNAAAAAMAPPPAVPEGLTEDRVRQIVQESAGGAAGGGGAMKKKVDVGQELYHVKRLLVGLYNVLGLTVPPDTLLGDPAEDPYSTPEDAANDPASSGATPAAQSAIKPVEPMQGASPAMAAAEKGSKVGSVPSNGEASSVSEDNARKAVKLAEILRSAAKK